MNKTFMKSRKQNLIRGVRNASFFLCGAMLVCWALWSVSCKKNDDNGGGGTPNLALIADNLVAPLTVMESPDGSGRLFVLDQVGKVWIIKSSGAKVLTPFIDISSKMVALQTSYDERGLLGMAFHPNYKTNGKFYLFYTAGPHAGGPQAGTPWNNLTRVSEFKVSSTNADVADISSERVILEADHPYLNHNGGTLAFGPDGYLYISIGDGGRSDDTGPGHVADWYAINDGGNAQNLSANLMGKVLRIDVNSGSPYSIPADNPFVSTPGAMKEIYAYGFRNPYRFSFDMGGTNALFLGDAGQSLYEEVDIVTKGGNYGWNVKEGTACFNTDSDKLVRPSCPTSDPTTGIALTDPIIQLTNSANPNGQGIASVIVGGNVYRGSALPALQGMYIFGIYSSGAGPDAKLFTAPAESAGSGLRAYTELKLKDFSANLGQYLKGFGQDLSGEIYVVTGDNAGPSGNTGKVYKLVGQ